MPLLHLWHIVKSQINLKTTEFFFAATVVDVDECTNNQDNCHLSVAKCLNTKGSYTCHCHLGHARDGTFITLLPITLFPSHSLDMETSLHPYFAFTTQPNILKG